MNVLGLKYLNKNNNIEIEKILSNNVMKNENKVVKNNKYHSDCEIKV
jgi:hypothetical protein